MKNLAGLQVQIVTTQQQGIVQNYKFDMSGLPTFDVLLDSGEVLSDISVTKIKEIK